MAMTSPAAALPARPGVSPNSKRAARVADRIVGDVMAMGWPVGELLGSEADLLERYRVSRAVFREAVRLVEHKQVARTRRGPGGGLLITEPTVSAVIDAVVLYLYRVEARLDELFEARIVLEEIVAELAPGRLGEQDAARLRAFVEGTSPDPDPRALHALLASISGNPALELFVNVLNRVAMLYSSGWQNFGAAVAADTVYAHARIAEAVIGNEPALARHRMRKHLEAEADYLRKRRSTRQLLPDRVVLLSQPSNGKRAEAVARRITQVVVGEGMQPGQLIGTERELIEREGVSRAVLREAVRLLEHHQIARMRRGPGGGLFVFEPSAAAVTEIVAIYLARRGMRVADLAELRTGVETAIAGLAAARIDKDGVAALRDALEREAAERETLERMAARREAVERMAARRAALDGAATGGAATNSAALGGAALGGAASGREASGPDDESVDVPQDLHVTMAGTARSRVLELVALVFIRLYQIEHLAPAAWRQIRAEMQHAHEAIAAAVESGDRDLARDRMRSHLDAVAALTRQPASGAEP
jgi:DNA-binding FadR family transcriptional regulator